MQVWTCHPFHAETTSLPCCHPRMRWRVCSIRCCLEPGRNFGLKSPVGGGWCQPVASLGGCETPTHCRAGQLATVLQGPSQWLVGSFFAEKPAGQRNSPSSRTSPGTVLQEVSLAEVVSCQRWPDVLRPSPHHCGHLNWIKRGRLG